MHRIAAKVARRLKKESTRSVVSLQQVRTAKEAAQRAVASVHEAQNLTEQGIEPIQAGYIQAQNLLSVLIEGLLLLPELGRFQAAIGEAEDQYLPSFPPNSSVTSSYFVTWSSFDFALGVQKETLTSVVLDLKHVLKLSPALVTLFEYFQHSRMGIYQHQGCDGEYAVLLDITTQKRLKVLIGTGYRGAQGELWFVRLVPNPLAPESEALCFTTPYVLLSSIEDWLLYFRRGTWRQYKKAMTEERQLKYGLTPCSWLEYVHQAYANVNGDSTAIYLQGIPDIAATRPHYSPLYPTRLPEAAEQ